MWEILKSKLSSKHLLRGLAIVVSLVWLAVFSFPDNRLRLVFCDVGQGDAILLIKGFSQVLIDGGPNDKVLSCLAKNMPFFDKTIEVVALTHPEADHLTGLNPVIDKYEVKYFITGPVGNEAAAYSALTEKLKNKNGKRQIKIKNVYAGEKIRVGEIILESVWPEKEWVTEKLEVGGEKWEMGLQTSPFILGAKTEHKKLNDFSLVFLLSYKGLEVLLMGDADSRIQGEMMRINSLNQVDILKFPHHGSKTGIAEEFLAKIKPKEAIISVGRNSYGHPTTEALDLLKKYGVKVRRTDLEGEIHYQF